jgi:hypothetical protein
MKDFFTKVLDKFHHPIGLLLFALGAILILLSVSQGLKIPGLENIVSEPSYRVTSLVIGTLLVLLSVAVALKGPKLPLDLATELSKPLAERRAKISGTQEEILRYIESRTPTPQSNMTEASIAKRFNMSGSEVYYRLEHLRLLGFIVKESLGGKGNNYYRLSPAYRKAFGAERAVTT